MCVANNLRLYQPVIFLISCCLQSEANHGGARENGLHRCRERANQLVNWWPACRLAVQVKAFIQRWILVGSVILCCSSSCPEYLWRKRWWPLPFPHPWGCHLCGQLVQGEPWRTLYERDKERDIQYMECFSLKAVIICYNAVLRHQNNAMDM